jgi:hypothetical protein
MPLSQLDAIFFVEEPPEIELRDGLFRLSTCIGGYRFERVMLPSTFARAVWRAEQALALFRNGKNVVELKAKVPPEELAASH